MTIPKVTPFKPEDHLETPERAAAFLTAAAAEDDPSFMIKALGIVARAHGMTDVAQQSGKSRENLYRALSDGGNPEAITLLGVIKALGFRLEIAPIGGVRQARRRRSAKGPAAVEISASEAAGPADARRKPRRPVTHSERHPEKQRQAGPHGARGKGLKI